VLDADLLDSWQAKVLRSTRGRLYAVMLSVLFCKYDDDPRFRLLLHLTHGGFRPRMPFICEAPRINKAGEVEVRLFDTDERTYLTKEWVKAYDSEIAFRDTLRRLADHLRLPDKDRIELFDACRNWLNHDNRIDPTMHPQDPDAKRLRVN